MKLKTNNKNIISIVIEGTQYEVVDGVASFKDEHIQQAKNNGFRQFKDVEEVEKVTEPVAIDDTEKKKTVRKK